MFRINFCFSLFVILSIRWSLFKIILLIGIWKNGFELYFGWLEYDLNMVFVIVVFVKNLYECDILYLKFDKLGS